MKKISILALMSVFAIPAFASDSNVTPAQHQQVAKTEHGFLHGVQIGAGLSATSGLNGFIGYVNKDFDSFWAKRFGLRFDFATTKPVKSLINDGMDSVLGDDGIDLGDALTINKGKVDAHHYAAMVDFYPFGDTWFLGGWRISGGYYMGDMNMVANIAGTVDGNTGYYEFELNGKKYAYAGKSIHGTGQLDWEYRGPYLGTGFDLGLFGGFKIYFDAGVVFTNKAAQLSLDVPMDNLKQWDGSAWVAYDAVDLESDISETLSEAQSELDDFKFYPVVKMGFMYRF